MRGNPARALRRRGARAQDRAGPFRGPARARLRQPGAAASATRPTTISAGCCASCRRARTRPRRAEAGLRGEQPVRRPPPAPPRRRCHRRAAASGSVCPITDVRATAMNRIAISIALLVVPLFAGAGRRPARRNRHPPTIPRRRRRRRRRSQQGRAAQRPQLAAAGEHAQGRPHRDRLGRRGPALRRRAQDRAGAAMPR